MGALPIQIEAKRELPDYLPARMVNEFAYCPQLFFYEWVEGLFAESVDTVEGSIQHRRVDAKATALPDAEELAESIHSRSVTLASERLRVIAKMDLVEVEDGVVTPVDPKGRETAGAAEDQRRRGTEHTWTKPESAAALMAVPKTEYLERRALCRGFPRDAFPPLVLRCSSGLPAGCGQPALRGPLRATGPATMAVATSDKCALPSLPAPASLLCAFCRSRISPGSE